MKYKLITLLALLSIAGCDLIQLPDSATGSMQTDNIPCSVSINISYYHNGRVENIDEPITEVSFSNDTLTVIASRVTVIHKDSIINYIIK